MPREERLDYLAALPADRQAKFRRILPREDVKKLNNHIDRMLRRRAAPSREQWLADARAGKASSPDAMVEVLLELGEKLRPQDASWISRITATASAGAYSRRQQDVIRGIYTRYFDPRRGS